MVTGHCGVTNTPGDHGWEIPLQFVPILPLIHCKTLKSGRFTMAPELQMAFIGIQCQRLLRLIVRRWFISPALR